MPHMLGVQDENSRVECDEMAEWSHPTGALATQTACRELCAPLCQLTLVTGPRLRRAESTLFIVFLSTCCTREMMMQGHMVPAAQQL